jgi:hypothetical protein
MSFVIYKEKKPFLAKDQLLIFLVHIYFGIQNVLERIMTFSKNLPGNISVLSAVGTTSKATICVGGKRETYEVSRPTILWFVYFRKNIFIFIFKNMC